MAPEVLSGKAYTSKNDVWALGCICYEILHQKLPYFAHRDTDILKAMEKTPADMLPYRLNIPLKMKQFIIKCL